VPTEFGNIEGEKGDKTNFSVSRLVKGVPC
jgi:hypothetical protein